MALLIQSSQISLFVDDHVDNVPLAYSTFVDLQALSNSACTEHMPARSKSTALHCAGEFLRDGNDVTIIIYNFGCLQRIVTKLAVQN